MIMKICISGNVLESNLNFRGNIIKTFLEKGHVVTLIAPLDSKIDVKKFDKRLEFIPVEFSRKSKNPFSDLIYCKKLYDIYKKEKFDIIFHYTIKPNIYGNIAAGFNKIKSISIITGLGHLFIEESFATKIVEILYKFSLRYAKEVWFLNEDDKKEFLRRKLLKEDKIKILPGEGIDLEKFKPIEKQRRDNKIVFLMIARVLWEKGYKEYVEATEILKKKYDNVEFRLLGQLDDDNPSQVPKKIVENDVKENNIKYLGVSNNIPEIISNCDCLVLPSYREGVPRTLMEGAAMEKFLITTNVTGCKEVVKDGYNGFLCEVKNSKDLANKMEKFINLSKKEKKTMGKNGRKLMKDKFEDIIIIEKYLKIIEEN